MKQLGYILSWCKSMLLHKAAMLDETTPGCSWLCCSSLSAYNHVKTSGSNTLPRMGQPEERLYKRNRVTFQGLTTSAFFELELPFFWRQKEMFYKPEDSGHKH